MAMQTSNAEREAIVVFLQDLAEHRRVREIRTRLVQRTQQEPEKVLLYLSTLSKEAVEADDLLRMLRAVATRALAEKEEIKLIP